MKWRFSVWAFFHEPNERDRRVCRAWRSWDRSVDSRWVICFCCISDDDDEDSWSRLMAYCTNRTRWTPWSFRFVTLAISRMPFCSRSHWPGWSIRSHYIGIDPYLSSKKNIHINHGFHVYEKLTNLQILKMTTIHAEKNNNTLIFGNVKKKIDR